MQAKQPQQESVEVPSSQTNGAAMRDRVRIGPAMMEGDPFRARSAMRLGMSSPITIDR